MFDEDGREAIIVEAKRFWENTRDHYPQLEEYCEGAKNIKAVLTNGRYWNVVIFDRFGSGYEEKPLGLVWDAPQETAQRLYDLLSRNKNYGRGGRTIRWKR